MTDGEENWKRFRIRRDGSPDLAFEGRRLADINYSDGYDRLYQTRSQKVVFATRDLQEDAPDDAVEERYAAEIFESMDDFVKNLSERFGPYNQRLKAILLQASTIDQALRKYYVEEI